MILDTDSSGPEHQEPGSLEHQCSHIMYLVYRALKKTLAWL